MAKRYYDYETLCDGMHDVVLKNGALHRCIDAGMILELPQADVVEVKHGKWIEKRNGHFKTDVPRCSLCSNASPFKYNYCPTCGADMGRKEDAKIH